MKKLYLLGILLFSLHNAHAQLVVTIDISEDAIADWIGGENVQLSNLIMDCSPEQYGQFTNTPPVTNDLDIYQGILMTSGTAIGVIGPNENTSFSGLVESGVSSDPDLEQLVPEVDINDVCRLTFDLVPNFDNLHFNFIFGSEEYPDFVNTIFNDAFAFIVSGPGINGPLSNNGENFALVPDTDMPISINNVNDQLNSDYYVNNGTGLEFPYCCDPVYIQYNGYTTNIEGEVPVVAGENYHVKIVIADAGDSSFDSGVLIQKNSFRSAQPSGVQALDILDINIYPNPAEEWLHLSGNDLSQMTSFQLISVDGKTVDHGSIQSNDTTIDISDLDAGFYSLQLMNDTKIMTSIPWVKK